MLCLKACRPMVGWGLSKCPAMAQVQHSSVGCHVPLVRCCHPRDDMAPAAPLLVPRADPLAQAALFPRDSCLPPAFPLSFPALAHGLSATR